MSRDWWWQKIKADDYDLLRIKKDFEKGLEECKPRLTENEVGWLIKQLETEKERADKLQSELSAAKEETARINCDYYADKQRFHDRARALEEAKERADKAEERESKLKWGYELMLSYALYRKDRQLI